MCRTEKCGSDQWHPQDMRVSGFSMETCIVTAMLVMGKGLSKMHTKTHAYSCTLPA